MTELNTNYTLEIDTSNKLIRYTHAGDLNPESIGLAWQELLVMPEFVTGGYDLMTDYRQAVYTGESEDMELIADHLSQYSSILKGKMQAIIFEDSYSTALTILFNNEVHQKTGFIVAVFTSSSEGLAWLKRNKDL